MQAPEKRKRDGNDHLSIQSIIRASGYLFPVTPEQVRAFEHLLEQKPEMIPAVLPDPMEVLRREKKTVKPIMNLITTNETYETYFRAAARNGKEISDEIRKKMENDRKNGLSSSQNDLN